MPATVEFVDIAGLVAGASTGEGLGNRFLGGIREVDAIVLVLRAFEDDNVVGDRRPARRPAHARARAGAGRRRLVECAGRQAAQVAQGPTSRWPARWRPGGGAGRARGGHADLPVVAARPSSAAPCGRTFLLTNKPVLAVVNLGEDQLADADALDQAGGRPSSATPPRCSA